MFEIREQLSLPTHRPAMIELCADEFAAACSHADFLVVRFPAQHFGVEEQFGSGGLGRIEVGLDAILDEQVAGVWFEDGVQILGHTQAGPAVGDFGGGKSFDRQMVLGRRTEHAGHDDAVGRADFDEADLVIAVGGRACCSSSCQSR